MSILLVRRPASTLQEGIVSHIDDHRDTVDIEKAQRQWSKYVDAFKRHNWHVEEVEKDDTLPDSVFIEDGIVYVSSLNGHANDSIAILASPGSEARDGEIAGIRKAMLERLSNVKLKAIERPGTLDGGDVLKVPADRLIYVGLSSRTNAEGLRQFNQFVEPLGWHVQSVDVKRALHLKSIVTALTDGRVIGYEPLIEDTRIFTRFVGVPEPEGVAIVVLDPEHAQDSPLLISSSAPRSREKLEGLGYRLIETEVSEFEKLEGCVTCLSVRVRR